jgi:8-oxo-dGTP pyrophosphatase MutT (NUDIX family)
MEKRALYDKNRNLTGEFIFKGDPVPEGRYYITVAVWIQNSKDEFLLQLRSAQKDHKWGITGGHPKFGEDSLQGLLTEIKEEIGVTVNPSELILFKTVETEDDFVDLYYLKHDIDISKVVVQPEEVECVKWASAAEIESKIADGSFHPEQMFMYEELKEWLDPNKV